MTKRVNVVQIFSHTVYCHSVTVYNSDFRVRFQESILNLDLFWFPVIITVEDRNISPFSMPQPKIDRGRLTLVPPAVMPEQDYPVPIFRQYFSCFICGAIINHYEFDIFERLLQDSINRLADEISPVIRGYYYGYLGGTIPSHFSTNLP